LRRKFKWSSKLLPKRNRKSNQVPGKQTSPELKRIQKNIYRQAALAGLTIVLTIVILFAMTSAWYTNIVQTSGLVFEAEPWGFDGTIEVSKKSIQAAPGDEGVVAMEVQNTSESISALSVNVSKAKMSANMQRRLFFYVDTHMTRDGETMDRVYINDFEGYNYTVFSKGQLTLTEEISNAPRIKWEWVYDVLGYYVMASPNKNDAGGILSMNVQDYLRPIVYDYDEATLVYSKDEAGNQTVDITTVDGKTPILTFLKELSKKDGYSGTINTDNVVYSSGKAYYPVDVDAQGNGVYAYLSSYSDIQMDTTWDTKLGKLAYRYAKNPQDETLTDADKQLLKHEATLRISAQNSDSNAVSVNNLSGLRTALNTADVVQLSSDITIPDNDSLVIPANTRAMIDLNEHTITGLDADGPAISVQQGSSLTLLNGSMIGQNISNGKGKGIETTGAEVIMSNITMSGFDNGVYMGDQNTVNGKANELDSRVHMVGCEIDANWYGVYINGNGTNSAQKTQLIVDDSVVAGYGYGITGSGNTNRSGTDIQILNGSTVKQNRLKADGTQNGTGAGIFQPQKDSTLTIMDSTVEGYTGIALKGGHANILDSEVIGYGGTSLDPKEHASKSGFADTADAVYIETNYEYDIRLQITNSILKHTGGNTSARSLRVYEEDAPNVTVQIVSGTFDEEQPAKYIAEGSEAEGTTVKVKTTAE